MALYRLCTICKQKVEYGKKCKCEIEKEKERYKEYNKRVRFNADNIKYAEFYNSTEWKRMVEYIRSKYNNVCLICLLKDGNVVQANVVHHLLEIRTQEGWEDRLKEDGLITLCYSCHNNLHLHGNYTQDKINMLRELIKRYKEEFQW